MLLESKNKKALLLRHFIAGSFAAVLVYIFWFSRSSLPFDARLWRALADTAFIFLFFTLAIGPLARLWTPSFRLLSWRRETGIWFALLSLSHFIRVINFALLEYGIELPRLLGLIALFWALVLAATSSDRAVNFLGISSWKWLHSMTYVIFYLVTVHAAYFLFWRYTESNWFKYPFLTMAFAAPLLQIAAFIKEVFRQRGGKTNMEIRKLQLPILSQKIIAEKTCEISFSLAAKNFDFVAGQHIRANAPKLLYPDPKGASRVFSVASSPNDKSKISIAFRDSGSGFKRTLMELPIDSLINIDGPFGYFALPKSAANPLVFIAGGIGITPMISMIRYADEKQLSHRITLLYANRNKESATYVQELEAIASQNSLFVVINKFGPLDAGFIQESIKDIEKSLWYIAGPLPMVAEAKNILSQLGVSENKIYSEEFFGY